MKSKWCSLILCLSFSLWTVAAPAKAFKTVVILPGGEFRIPTGLAMVGELVRRGITPGLVIWTCGLAVNGGILNAMNQIHGPKPDPDAWLAFMLDEFVPVIQGIRVNQDFFHKKNQRGNTGAQELYDEISWRMGENGIKKIGAGIDKLLGGTADPIPVLKPPKIFRTTENSLVNVPFHLAPKNMDLKFGSQGIRSLMVTTRVKFTKAEADSGLPRDRNVKLYQEVYHTDKETAAEIARAGFSKSAIAQAFPKAPIDTEILVRSDVPAFEAARASLSEPYYVPLMYLPSENDPQVLEPYLTGALNVEPLELALALGDEVIAVKMRPAKPLENMFYRATFGFGVDERIDYIAKHFYHNPQITHWLNFDDIPELEARAGFTPKQVETKFPRDRTLVDVTPKDPEQIRERVREQWKWGVKKVSDLF